MKAAVRAGAMRPLAAEGLPAEFDASCFDGIYVTGDITAQDVERLGVSRQLAQQVDREDDDERTEPTDTAPMALPDRS